MYMGLSCMLGGCIITRIRFTGGMVSELSSLVNSAFVDSPHATL